MSHKNEILQKFRYIPDRLELVCIGTTQAHFAFDFHDSPVRAFNMALYRNPMMFSGLLLERYRGKLQKHTVVLMTIEYPIFCIDCFRKIAKENAVQYAKVLPGRNPYISRAGQTLYRAWPACFDRQMKRFMALQDAGERNQYINHHKPWEIKALCRDLIRYGWEREIGVKQYVMDGHKKDSARANTAMKRSVSQAVKLVHYCREQGWKPILLGLPYSGALNQYVPDSFKEKCFYRNIRCIQKQTGCRFLDYSADERIQDLKYYIDIWFLNKRGRRKFTQMVLEDAAAEMEGR